MNELPNELPNELLVEPLTAPPCATIEVPGSKSLTNRALILAALAEGTSTLRGALASTDTRVMLESLRRLGFEITAEADGTSIRVGGCGGRIPATAADLFIDNSGTSIRFLTALCALGSGAYRLDGVSRMRERPQADLLAALRTLGVDARSERDNGCPPLLVTGSGGLAGGAVTVNSEASSQFLSALLMVAPAAQSELRLTVGGRLRPLYVELTCRMMAQWGVEARTPEDGLYAVSAPQAYRAQTEYRIEPDASAASYFFAAAAITGGSVVVPGLSQKALQGDVRFAVEVLPLLGCTVSDEGNALKVKGPADGRIRGIDIDMSAISDTSLTLAAIAPFADGPTVIRNIAHTRLQECDRIAAVCTELKRMGIEVDERPDGMTIYPVEQIRPALVRTYGDHRIAMSFAVTGLRAKGITIQDPSCTAKTFPNFWEKLAELRGA